MIYTTELRKVLVEYLNGEGIHCEIDEMEDSKWIGIVIKDNTNTPLYLNEHRNDFVVVANGGRINSDELNDYILSLKRYEKIILEIKNIIKNFSIKQEK